MFRLSPSADTTGITSMGEIEVSPALIVQRFGPPACGDDYKVSGEYVFTGENGKLFIVHDWKSTSLWESELLPPRVFCAREEAQELTISSRDLGHDGVQTLVYCANSESRTPNQAMRRSRKTMVGFARAWRRFGFRDG